MSFLVGTSCRLWSDRGSLPLGDLVSVNDHALSVLDEGPPCSCNGSCLSISIILRLAILRDSGGPIRDIRSSQKDFKLPAGPQCLQRERV
jgi:hypothetical protein